ncbi:hypothetical protein HanRHA438_Chr06g0264221 [Helianthus annuus]|nr:hypothetical protein HanIR_Chr06g0274461 [Helianthus annuus]KAJ0911533.1 hypothetical protein HanRHA438_Chr06g0264221 [Helianthus annuus]
MNQNLHHLRRRETILHNLHLHQPVLNRQPLPQNPNRRHHFIHLLLLRIIKSVHRSRRSIIRTLSAEQILHPLL